MTTLINKLKQVRTEIDASFEEMLPSLDGAKKEVLDAICYSFIGGGKAIRPFLVLTLAENFGVEKTRARQVALALEMVHTYSLIHDDLPAMDNDTLRRGKATCHIKFSEATAILAGDALLTHAFEVLADEKTHPNPLIRCQLITLIAKSAGIQGMIGGQMMDLSAEKKPLSENEIYQMQALKTGALLKFACIAPAILAEQDVLVIKALSDYADAIGLLFQITDDLLDENGSEAMVGKTLKKDKKAGKSTFLSHYSEEQTKQLASQMHLKSIEALKPLSLKPETCLKELADFILTRTY